MKKRTLCTMLALALLLGLLSTSVSAAPAETRGGGGGGLLWNCEFASFYDVTGWQMIDANGDGYTFGPYFETEEDETMVMRSDRGNKTLTDKIYSSDDYLISPPIELTNGALQYTLGLVAAAESDGYNVGCEIYVYAGQSILTAENLYSLLDDPYRYDYFYWNDWRTDYMDLSAFAGQTIQLVFRVHEDDASVLKLNRVFVSWQEPDESLSRIMVMDVPMPELGLNVDSIDENALFYPVWANYELAPGGLQYYKIVNEQSVRMQNEVFTEDGEYQIRLRFRPINGAQPSYNGYASVNGHWAQYTYDDSAEEIRVDYFNLPSLKQTQEIREVNLHVENPVPGTTPAATAEPWLENGASDPHYSVSWVDWYPSASQFQSGEPYYFSAVVQPDSGWSFADDAHYTINGQPTYLHYNLQGMQYVELQFEADQGPAIDSAQIHLTMPKEGENPEDAWSSDERCSTQWSYWFPLNAWGEPQEPMEDDDVFEPDGRYRYVFSVLARDGYQIDRATRIYLNGKRVACMGRGGDGSWYYYMDMKAKSKGPVTITFNSHGYGTPPDPVVIPYGEALWSYLNPDDFKLPDTDRLTFFGWSESTRDWTKDLIGNIQTFEEDTTLYALWAERTEHIDLYVDAPAAGEQAGTPRIGVPNSFFGEAIPVGWYTRQDGFFQSDEEFTGTFRAGQTYYATVRFKPEIRSIFAEGDDLVSVHGATELREDLWYEDELYVTFSVTIPKKAVTSLEIFTDIRWPGWLVNGTPPLQLCLTPGVTLTEGSWWENPEDVGDQSKAISGRFPTDCLIYTDLLATADAGCSMNPNTVQVSLQGGTLIRTEPADASGGVHIIYSVFSPAYHGMEYRSQGSGWFFVDDDPHGYRWHEAPYTETGSHVVTATPDPGWHFVGWYEGPNAETLVSTNPVHAFDNEPAEQDLYLTAVFEEGLLPLDLVRFYVPIPAAGDSFNWETDTAGAVGIINGNHVTVVRESWYNEWGVSGNPLPFEAGQNYFVELDLKAKPGYVFTEDTVVLINNEAVVWKQLNGEDYCSVASRNYTMAAAEDITRMDVTLHHVPAAGETFVAGTDVVYASTMAQIDWLSTLWCKAEGSTAYPLAFRYGGQYYAYLEVHGQPGWRLTDDTAVTVDGQPAVGWEPLGAGRYALITRVYTVHEEMTIPAVEVYANIPVFDVEPDEPYIPDYEPYEVEDWEWSDAQGSVLPKNFTVEGGAQYTLTVKVKPRQTVNGYMFSAEELVARLFWDEAEIVSVEPHRVIIRASCTAGMGTPNPFVDVKKTDYFYEAVLWAYYHEPRVTSGTDATHFSPKKGCTRGQVVTFLWHANNDPTPSSLDNPFTDVKEGKYYFEPVMWAYHSSPRITGGTGATTFGVSKTCTREQVVTFLWKAAGAPEPKSTECAFTDVNPEKYYYKAVLWAVENKITGGVGGGKFGVGKTCTRAQIVTFLYAAYGPKG